MPALLALNRLSLDSPREIAFVDQDYEVNFQELNSDVRKIANSLAISGISRGDIVCTILPNLFSYTFTLALHLLGVTTMSKNDITPFAAEAIPDWLISFKPHPQIAPSRTVILDEPYLTNVRATEEMVNPTGYQSPTDIARLFSTSGTSGAEKYTAVTVEGLDELVSRQSSFDFAGQDHVLTLFPFGMGQSYGRALISLVQAKPYFSCTNIDNRLPEILNRYQIKTVYGSPVQVAKLLDVLKQTHSTLPSISGIYLTGSAPSQQLIDRIKAELKCKVFNAYGSTEAGNIAMMDVTGQIPQGSVMNPTVDLQIVDENDVEVAPNTLGRIRYSKPGMSTSYYKSPAATAEFFKDGYFYPGDLAFINDAGLLVLGGRSSEVINLGGVKVNPEKVDEIAMAQLGVIDCAAFAVSAASGIETMAIALVVDADFNQELFDKAMAQKSPYPPAISIQMAKIPRNDNGKVSRQLLRAEYQKANPAPLA